MNIFPLFPRTSLIEFRSALAIHRIRTQEDCDELVHVAADCDVRLNLSQLGNGQLIHCFISVEEDRMLSSGMELFNEISSEGHPVVAYGAGRGHTTLEFEWLHQDGANWRISAERVELLTQRLRCAVRPKSKQARRAGRRRPPAILEGVIAHVSAA